MLPRTVSDSYSTYIFLPYSSNYVLKEKILKDLWTKSGELQISSPTFSLIQANIKIVLYTYIQRTVIVFS